MTISAFNIESYLDAKGIRWKNIGKNIGKNWVGVEICPYCGTANYHLGISKETSNINCWVCGKHSLTSFIREIEQCSWEKAQNIIDGLQIVVEKEQKIDLSSPYIFPISFSEAFPDPYKLYLQNRKYDFHYLRKHYNILCGGDTGRARYRIIFPICEVHNSPIVNWCGRTIVLNNSAIMPYMFELDENNPIVSRRELLFGLDKCKNSVILVEGVFDAIRLGFGAIALLSVNFTSAQIKKLTKFKKVFIMFDNDNAGQKKARELERMITWGDVKYIEYDAKDPDSLSEKDVKLIRRMVF